LAEQRQAIGIAKIPIRQQWDKTFGGSDYDNLHAIVPTSDGGFLLGGIRFPGKVATSLKTAVVGWITGW